MASGCHVGQLAWLVHVMAQVLAQQKFTASQIEVGEEILDAEYCKRVFTLSHSIGYRLSNVALAPVSHVGAVAEGGRASGAGAARFLPRLPRHVGTGGAFEVDSRLWRPSPSARASATSP